MISQKATFKKSYTRDTSLVIQQLFPEMAEVEFKKVGWINPHGIASIHHMTSGVTQVWENVDFHSWMMQKLFEENSRGDNFFDYHAHKFVENKKMLAKLWNEESGVVRPEDLVEALKLIRKTMFGFCVMYWSGLDERTPDHIIEKTLFLRKEDSFWDNNDAFIRSSIRKLYPKLVGYEVAILKQEIVSPPTLSDLKKRVEGFTIGGAHFAELGSLDEFVSYHEEFEFIIEDTETYERKDSVQGSVANKGYAKGTVRILRKVEDVAKVKMGDIIVSPMTTPNYITAMRRAGAFVTDEGGVLCHAAIISREMNKPCVVGTKYATKVFKDGDIVEVNGEPGIVSKIRVRS